MAEIVPCDYGEAAPYLDALADGKTDTAAGSLTVEESCRGAECFLLVGEGGVMGAYALRVVSHDAGRVVWIQAAAGGAPGVDLTKAIVPVIERQAAGALQVAITTRRRGLVKKLVKQGYVVSGVTLRKRLQ